MSVAASLGPDAQHQRLLAGTKLYCLVTEANAAPKPFRYMQTANETESAANRFS